MEEKKEQTQKGVKNNKKTLLIIIISIIVVISLIVTASVSGIFKPNSTKDPETKEEIKKEEKEEESAPPEVTPASNTEELIQNVAKVEVKEVTKDKIIFNEEAKVEVGEKVAVWVYSEPKFLGYFLVKEENGLKIIEGLEDKLAELEIESGNHNIAITTMDGTSIGYVDVEIKEGTLKEEVKPIIKEVKETEVIKFKTETKTNSSLIKGTQKTIQEGSNGEKEITYEVTYNAEGIEISRTKISEKVTKNAVNKIIETGSADFSLSTSFVTEEANGFFCLSTAITEYGCEGENTPQFKAIQIDGQYYAKCYNDSATCTATGLKAPTKLTKNGDGDLIATINGKQYYFDPRAGQSFPDQKLTAEICNQFNFTCAN